LFRDFEAVSKMKTDCLIFIDFWKIPAYICPVWLL
jgi:hypothetical protein